MPGYKVQGEQWLQNAGILLASGSENRNTWGILPKVDQFHSVQDQSAAVTLNWSSMI